jgi:hypothetical protein
MSTGDGEEDRLQDEANGPQNGPRDGLHDETDVIGSEKAPIHTDRTVTDVNQHDGMAS